MKVEIYDGRDTLWQWDINCKLKLYGVDPDTEVHFAYCGDPTAIVVLSYTYGKDVVCDVPNILLQRKGVLRVYVCPDSSTVEKDEVYVRCRSRPACYAYTETEILCWRDLDERITKLEQGGIALPDVTEADNGKILGVVNGQWGAMPINISTSDYAEYDGAYEVVPDIEEQTLDTAQKLMKDNVTIKKIPYYDVGNTSGGSTVYIASEIE